LSKKRISKTGKLFKELDKPVTITIKTKCPEKYILVDMETGQFYAGTEDSNWRELKGS
jgi:hypothetical protein